MKKRHLRGAVAIAAAATLAFSPICATAANVFAAEESTDAIYLALSPDQSFDKSYFNGPGGASVQVFQADTQAWTSFYGTAESLDPTTQRFSVMASDSTDSIPSVIATVGASTRILDATDGTALQFSDLKEHESVYVYTDPFMALSYPPQAGAQVVLAHIPADYRVPSLMEVDTTSASNEEKTILGTSSGINVTLSDDCEIFSYDTRQSFSASDIKPGHKLLVWHDLVLTSYPGQTSATKVMVFPYDYDGYVFLSGDEFLVNGTPLSLRADAGLRVTEETCLLPLRQVTEQMGFQVIWNGDDNSISIVDEAKTLYIISLGSATTKVDGNDLYLIRCVFEENGVSYITLDDLLFLHNLKMQTRF